MEEQTAAENNKKVWSFLVDDLLFRLAGKPRKWEDWHLPSLQERKEAKFCSMKAEIMKIRRMKTRSIDDKLRCWLLIKLVRHLKLLENEPPETQELYLQVLELLVVAEQYPDSNRVANYISNPFIFDDDCFWKQIAVHNLSLDHKFQDYKLDWKQWSDYPQADFEFRGGSNFSDKWEQLNKELDSLVEMFAGDKLQPSLKKDCISIKQKKQEILGGKFKLSQSGWLAELFPVYYQSKAYLEKKLSLRHRINMKILDKLSHSNFPWGKKALAIKELILELSEFLDRRFVIKLWDRNKFSIIFSGNWIGSCLNIGLKNKNHWPAVTLPGVPGNKIPAGILDYIVDLGVQVVEIKKIKDGNEIVAGQCYLYVFLDNDKPVLMVDSIDFDRHYHLDRRKLLNQKMRNELFEFLKNYARAIGIERVVIAKNGPILESGKKKGEKHVIGNDVDVSDLPVTTFEKIDKLGGYWNHQPYFLESIGGTEAYKII